MMLHENESIQQVAQIIMRRVTAGHLASTAGVEYLARDIVQYYAGVHSPWGKWSAARTNLLNAAKRCWIPVSGLQEGLNRLPGQPLTVCDIEQREKALWETSYDDYRREDLRDDCLAIYEAEKVKGTELVAIVGAINDLLEKVDHRESQEKYERAERKREAEQHARERRLQSGLDCDWTTLGGGEDLFLQSHGRLFRLTKIEHLDWELTEIPSLDCVEGGKILGRFKGRGLARAAIYQRMHPLEPEEVAA